ncbi:type I-E CRISPR-associated protein Cse2/CasB [Pseudofrankia sp. EUN1h]|nr:type I-E CRISPR-associated protein Cse2/CasB [Pseudofrankia sp. EUN1h]
MRRGVGREAGSVPEMWGFYRMLTATGRASEKLQAEHTALTLYAVHQQSISDSMHRPGVGLGRALLRLRQSGTFSVDAVDRRFNAAATATSLDEASYHLRGLVRQLRGIPQGLDYTRLFQDLVAWQVPEQISTVRRRWGRDYFTGRDQTEKAI